MAGSPVRFCAVLDSNVLIAAQRSRGLTVRIGNLLTVGKLTNTLFSIRWTRCTSMPRSWLNCRPTAPTRLLLSLLY